ncbi:unnamed protein product [Caenorhabditis angaria]|uniref:DUF4440 domain-containing protein n=1 Tax=Caenorhabditis angaria TaxID=860376 RepID=A0A9P1IEA8_9PELO|nr:unnamed protein product [Caenorhabditis angaria]
MRILLIFSIFLLDFLISSKLSSPNPNAYKIVAKIRDDLADGIDSKNKTALEEVLFDVYTFDMCRGARSSFNRSQIIEHMMKTKVKVQPFAIEKIPYSDEDLIVLISWTKTSKGPKQYFRHTIRRDDEKYRIFHSNKMNC